MSEPVTVEFEYTGEHVFRAKMLHWRRRSAPRYVVSAALIGIGIYVASGDLRSSVAVFMLVGLSLIGLSAAVIAISTELLVKRRREAGRERVRLHFSPREIQVEDGETTTKDWSWVKHVLRTGDALALRTRDGLFRKTYFFVPRSAPQHDALDALLAQHVK
ncbi:MAG: hypothetical protein ABW352_23255 [Polyangiales bacterium]